MTVALSLWWITLDCSSHDALKALLLTEFGMASKKNGQRGTSKFLTTSYTPCAFTCRITLVLLIGITIHS
jgi:hypothetical protein